MELHGKKKKKKECQQFIQLKKKTKRKTRERTQTIDLNSWNFLIFLSEQTSGLSEIRSGFQLTSREH